MALFSPLLEQPCHHTRPQLDEIPRYGTLHRCLGKSRLRHLLHGSLDCQPLAYCTPEPIDSVEELYPIALVCLLWGHQWTGKKLLFRCDNQAVVDIWASGSSRDPLIMHLVCSIFFTAATNHFTVLVTHTVGMS